MKLRLKKDELQRGLQRIQGVVERKTTMPILSHFLLKVPPMGAKEGLSESIVFIVATDLEIVLQESIRALVYEPGNLCIPGKKLFEIVRELEGELVIETDGTNRLLITSGVSSFKLVCLSEDDFPSLPEVEQARALQISSSVLKKMIEKTYYATGESDARYAMNGVLMHFMDDNGNTVLRMVGTDGHRLAIVTHTIQGVDLWSNDKEKTEGLKFILPKKAAMELKNILPETPNPPLSEEEEPGSQPKETSPLFDTTIGLGDNHIFFKIPDKILLEDDTVPEESRTLLLTSRLIEGIYPDYEQVLSTIGESLATVNRDEFYKALRRVSIISREKTNAARLDFENNRLTLSSTNPELGEAKDEIALSYEGDPLPTGFNARFLMDSLQAMDGAVVQLYLKSSLSPILLKEGESEYKCVVMPMRI